MEQVLTMTNLKLKPPLFTPYPSRQMYDEVSYYDFLHCYEMLPKD